MVIVAFLVTVLTVTHYSQIVSVVAVQKITLNVGTLVGILGYLISTIEGVIVRRADVNPEWAINVFSKFMLCNP